MAIASIDLAAGGGDGLELVGGDGEDLLDVVDDHADLAGAGLDDDDLAGLGVAGRRGPCRAARSKIGMILPRRPMTPRIQAASDATERGSVKRMISCTAPIGSAYSSPPSENTTSCWEVSVGHVHPGHRPRGRDLSGRSGGIRRGSVATVRSAGNRTTKRAPRPSSGGSSATLPWCELGHRAHDREPEAARVRCGRPRRGRSARRPCRCSSGRDARPVVLDREHDLAVAALDRGLDGRARVGVAQRVLHQVEHEPVQLVARALDLRRRGGAETEISWSPATGSSSAAASVTTLGEVDGRCGGCAPGVGAGEQQQVGDQPAHPPRGAQRGGGGLALLAVERPPRAARGWPAPRSAACAARARRRRRTRAGGPASPRSPRAPRRARASIASSVRASSATSSSASGRGIRTRRVARARDRRARRRSARRSAPSRAARWPGRPAGRAAAPPRTPRREEQLHAVGRRLHVGQPARVLQVDRGRAGVGRCSRSRVSIAPAVDVLESIAAMSGPKLRGVRGARRAR